MNKVKDSSLNYVGIDISKDCFDVFSEVGGFAKFSNNTEGFALFLKALDTMSCCVMEATGCYHHQLAKYLYYHQIQVSVMNPLIIKRYVQMKLHHTKTDKSDARMIACYARDQQVSLWVPELDYIDECKMLQNTIEVYFKQSTALKKVHSLHSKGVEKGILLQSLKRQINRLKLEIVKLEVVIERLVSKHEQAMMTNITSIPGIGTKTALLLIAHTNGFKSFDNS